MSKKSPSSSPPTNPDAPISKRQADAMQVASACREGTFEAVTCEPVIEGRTAEQWHEVYRFSDEPDAMLQAIEKAIRLDPNNATYRYGYSMVLYSVDRNDEALKEAQEAVRLSPETGYFLEYYTSILEAELTSKGQIKGKLPDELMDQYLKAVELDDSLTEAWERIGYWRQVSGDTEGAIEAYEKCAHHHSHDQRFFHNLGHLYNQVGRHEDAIEAFKGSVLARKYMAEVNRLADEEND